MRLSASLQSGWITMAMVLLYIVSIVWHTVHPMVSILSGRFKGPLTPFVDENSIDATFTRAPSFDTSSYPAKLQGILGTRRSLSLCKSLKEHTRSSSSSMSDAKNIPCFSFSRRDDSDNSTINVAVISPHQAPVAPTNEALVLVFPFNWASQSGLNKENTLVGFLHHLAQAPWLAKTIFVVAPVARDTTISTTTTTATAVTHFLDRFVGTKSSSHALPLGCSGALIRQLIVLDNTVNSPFSPSIMISPQGYRGIMPNMDLYSVAYKVFAYNFSPRMIRSYPGSIEQRSKPWKDGLRSLIKDQQWSKESLLAWWDATVEWIIWEVTVATSLATSDIPTSHAAALDRGIDALTLQAINLVSNSKNNNSSLRTFLKSVEMILHAFSNAHERLHHNTALFALPRNHGNAYVKHEEFLIPNLLLLAPLIVRAVTLVMSFRAKPRVNGLFDYKMAGAAVQFILGGTLMIAIVIGLMESQSSNLSQCRFVIALSYVVLSILWIRWVRSHRHSSARQQGSKGQTLQLVACLLALYLQAGIAFGNLSLAYPSALFWTPPIAFVAFQEPPDSEKLSTWMWAKKAAWLLLSSIFLFLASPMAWIVPNVFSEFTAYMKYIYVPLHLATSILLLS